MRRNRIILAVLWILSLAAISFTGGTISYSFFALFTLLPVSSLLYILYVYVFFRIYQNLEGRTITCNHSKDFLFILQNESFLAFSGIRVLFYSSFSTIHGLDDSTEYMLRPHSGIRKETKIVCHYRGEYEVGIKAIVIQDFLRLFAVTCKNREPFIITVHPDIVELEDPENTDLALQVLEEVPAHGSDTDVFLREYVEGDDVRRINWKVSAARKKLMVREMIGEQHQGIGIIMDSCRYDPAVKEYLPVENKLLETVIALNLYYSRKGIPVKSYFESGGPGSTLVDRDRGFGEFYDTMCSFSFRQEQTASVVCADAVSQGDLFSKKAVFLIIHACEDAFVQLAAELARNSIPVIVYLITDKPGQPDSAIWPSKTVVLSLRTDARLEEVL